MSILTSKFQNWLVVYLPLLKNMASSIGMMKFPTYMENKIMSQTTQYHTITNQNTLLTVIEQNL